VLDDRGRPVAGAQVRLADGSTPFGRSVGTVTDDSEGGHFAAGARPSPRREGEGERSRGHSSCSQLQQ
jgi:hypothetical protein